MSNNDKSNAFFVVEIKEEIDNFFTSGGVKIASRFVSKDDFWIINNGTSNTNALLLTTGKIIGFVVGFGF